MAVWRVYGYVWIGLLLIAGSLGACQYAAGDLAV